MLPDRVSNPGPVTYESDALPIALRGPSELQEKVPKVYRYSAVFPRHFMKKVDI